MKNFGLFMIVITNIFLPGVGYFAYKILMYDSSPISTSFLAIIMCSLIIVWIPVVVYFTFGIASILSGIFLPPILIISFFYLIGAAALKFSIDEQYV